MIVALLAFVGIGAALPPPHQTPLIVVADDGSQSALPYYRAIHLLPDATAPTPAPPVPPPPGPYSESDMLPIRSTLLSPGPVVARPLHATGMPPFFLVGDDARSLAWLGARRDALRALGAMGFVVHIDTQDRLTALRRAAPGLTLVPASCDDLAKRLALTHYPVLVTAHGIEP